MYFSKSDSDVLQMQQVFCFSHLLVNAAVICHHILKKDCQQLLFMHPS